jgi:hypothetical protein
VFFLWPLECEGWDFLLPLILTGIAFLPIIAIFYVLTSPIGLLAILLDAIVSIIVGIFSPVKSSTALNNDTTLENESNNSLIILTQAQEALMDLKCQLEWIQCQLKNSFIHIKSIVEK